MRDSLRTLHRAFFLTFALSLAVPCLAQDPAAEQKANELKQQADEAVARQTQAKQALDELQAKAKPFRDALTKLKADELKANAVVQSGEKDLPPKQEAAKKAADAYAPMAKAIADLQTAANAANEAKVAADKAAQDAAAAAKTAAENAAKAKEALDKDANNADLAAAKTAADKAAADTDAASKAATEKAAAAAKAVEEANAKVKAETDKAAPAAKAAADTAAAVKLLEEQIAVAKATQAKTPEEVKQNEAQLAAIQPQLDAAIAAYTAVTAEAVGKSKAAEQALADIGKFVIFSKQVAPIFAKRCLACHNARTAKGRYNMETYAGVMKGGEQGDTVVPGDGDLSNLIVLINDGSMPKDADPLTKDEIATVKKWLQLGAKLDAGMSTEAPLVTIMPKPAQPAPPDAYRVPMPITALAFNPDGSQLASSGYHEVVVWNPNDGAQIRRITNLAERTYEIQYSPDGTLIAVAAGTPGQMGEVKLFNAADGQLVKDLVTTSDAMFAVAFSPDGKRLAAAGADRAIRVFDVGTGKQELLIEDHADWVQGIAWSPDGKKLASASRDKTSKLFDAEKGESLVTFPGHQDIVYGVVFSPDGNQVATSGRDKQIRIWNVGDAKQIRNFGGFGSDVFRIILTPDKRVFSTSADKNAREHNFDNGQNTRNFTGHQDWVYAVAFNAATKKLATGSWDGEIRIWNAEDAKGLATFIAAPGYQPPQAAAAAAAAK